MVSNNYGLVARVALIDNFLQSGLLDGSTRYCESEEQLWLAFVMKEKFGKTWGGEEWV